MGMNRIKVYDIHVRNLQKHLRADPMVSQQGQNKRKTSYFICNCTIPVVPLAIPMEKRTLRVLLVASDFQYPFLFWFPFRSLRQKHHLLCLISVCTGNKQRYQYVTFRERFAYTFFKYVHTDFLSHMKSLNFTH